MNVEFCHERDETGAACVQVKDHAAMGLPHLRYPHTTGLVVQPPRRGTLVLDRKGRVWRRENTLWHHLARPGEEWLGRWPWSEVLRAHGPLRFDPNQSPLPARCPACGHWLMSDGAEGLICGKRGGCGAEWDFATIREDV